MPIPNLGAPTGMIPLDPVLGTNPAGVSPPGALRVEQQATQLFWEGFNTGTLDPNNWTATAGGTGIAPTSVQGSTVLSGGTTLNSFSRLQSVPVFRPTQPGFLITHQNNNLEFPVLTTAYRFWGYGNLPTTPTIAAPVTDGVGFEIGTNGQLAAVTWAAGVRTLLANLAPIAQGGTGKQPQDANTHKYYVYFTGDVAYWAIDNQDNVVATYQSGAFGPANNTMGACAVVVSNAGTAATITVNGVTVGDNAHGNVTLSDGAYPFRKMAIASNAQYMVPAANYTPITTAGTTTVAVGTGVYLGAYIAVLGAAPVVSVLDGTNTIAAAGTGTAAGQFLSALPGGVVGTKFNTSLIVITSGTVGQVNAMWD